jgi:hypothetical protein
MGFSSGLTCWVDGRVSSPEHEVNRAIRTSARGERILDGWVWCE